MSHIPVMLNEVLEYLSPVDGGVYFDGTFGGGGYTRAILESCNCRVIATDRDKNVLPNVKKIKQDFGDRFMFSLSRFSDIEQVLASHNLDKIDGIVLDVGVSSFQIDDPERGFSFNKCGDLDMRMGLNEMSALDAIRNLKESDLADIIYEYGEERASRRIAKAIKQNCKNINTTMDLANVIHSVMPRNFKRDTATKTFQALRIFVNNELEELEFILKYGINFLGDCGRVVVVSFHSLEDRVVKNVFNSVENAKILTKKPVVPSDSELDYNQRSRSAKLRALMIEKRL